jgi:A/G-specific adenine glycosylase
LPWQYPKTPYRVWVSEIMLQQTQVNTVIPYYTRFMQRFPDLHTLAHANEEEVLHLWAGLGYYTRARNLYCAAKMIEHTLQGIFPDTLTTLQQLPGIGLSTAGAILAIAFNQPAAILDGNVKRVLARFHGITESINNKHVENTLWKLAQRYTPKIRIADYTQAMMDLGATVCMRVEPQCKVCPLAQHCYARLHKMTALLPRKKITRETPTHTRTFIILKKDHHILLYKRPDKGIWGGLWSLPEISGEPEKEMIKDFCSQHFQFQVGRYQKLTSFKHRFSHYHLIISPVLIKLKKKPAQAMAAIPQIWYNLHQPEKLGLPKPIQSIMSSLL